MTNTTLTDNKRKGYWGEALTLLGLIALLANLDTWIGPLANMAQSARSGLPGLLASGGLSLLRAAGDVLLGQVDYFSLASRILLLFSAMVAVIVGMALISSRSATADASSRAASALTEEEPE